MKNLTPAMLLSAAAVTSAALMGACHDRDRDNSSISRTDSEPVVRDGAVVTPQSGLTSSRDEVANSPATSRDRAAASASTTRDARNDEPSMRVAGTENPDPPTPAEPTREQFIFEQNRDSRYGRVESPSTDATRTQPTRSDERAWSERRRSEEMETVTQRDGSLDTQGSAREMTMGPIPTRPVPLEEGAPDERGSRVVVSSDPQVDRRQRTREDHVVISQSPIADNSKAPDPPTAAVPTRESFQFSDNGVERSGSDAGDRPRSSDWKRNDAEMSQTSRDREPVNDSSDARSRSADRSSDTTDSYKAREHVYEVPAHTRSSDRAADNSKAPDPPTPATPTRDDFQFSSEQETANGGTRDVDRSSPDARDRATPTRAVEDTRQTDRARVNRQTRVAESGLEPALHESDGQVYPDSPESRILAILHAKNVGEIEMGRLALERSNSQQVRDYAEELIREHQLADERVRELAMERGYALPEAELVHRMLARENAEPVAPSAYEQLRRKEGREFDEEYIAQMTRGHAELLRIMRHTQPTIQDDVVHALLEDLVPTIESHETAAYQLTARY